MQNESLDIHFNKDGIRIHSTDSFKSIRKAGNLAAEILDSVTAVIHPGITTEKIDSYIFTQIGCLSMTCPLQGISWP